MKLNPIALVVLALAPTPRVDVADELARMLAKHPEADANRDGKLTEDDAGDYLLRTFQRKRPNRGPGIRNRALIDVYESRSDKSMPNRLHRSTLLALSPASCFCRLAGELRELHHQ